MARKKREFSVNLKSPTTGRGFWGKYARADDMKMKQPRKSGLRMIRPKSYRPRRKRYGRGRRR